METKFAYALKKLEIISRYFFDEIKLIFGKEWLEAKPWSDVLNTVCGAR